MKEIMTMYIQEATLFVWHDEVEIPFKLLVVEKSYSRQAIWLIFTYVRAVAQHSLYNRCQSS